MECLENSPARPLGHRPDSCEAPRPQTRQLRSLHSLEFTAFGMAMAAVAGMAMASASEAGLGAFSSRQFVDGVLQQAGAVITRYEQVPVPDGDLGVGLRAAPPGARAASPLLCPLVRA